MQPEEDKSLWEILPTTFKTDAGPWKFRKITVQDMVELEEEGLPTEKILSLDLIPLINLSYRFLQSQGHLPTELYPSLIEYRSMLSEQSLDDAMEAFRNTLTNFIPRANRIAARTFMKEQEKYLAQMAAAQGRLIGEMIAKSGTNMESLDSLSTVPESSESNPGDGPSVSYPLHAPLKAEASVTPVPQSETPSKD